MEEEKYITFKKFNDKESAIELSNLLSNNGIENKLEDLNGFFDPSFAINEINNDFRIKIIGNDFVRANKILQDVSEESIPLINDDYYLYTFTDEELIEVIYKHDEWNHLDFTLAKKLLKERGKEINEVEIEKVRTLRLNELAQPEAKQTMGILFGYIFAFLGGIIGIFIGRFIATHKKTLPNGEKVFAYCATDRNHGNRIVLIGIIFIIFWLTVRFLNFN